MRCRLMLMGAALCALMLSGCAEPAVFSEALQMKQGDKIYTACNIWFEDPEKIDCRNIQRGSFIPVGTEIEPVETTGFTRKIVFKDLKGKRYTILFSEEHRLCPMSDFIAYTFTTKSREEQLKGIPQKIRARILRGEVVPGMNMAQVQMAYGLPPALRTPDLRNDCWLYYTNDAEMVRVVFRGGIVRNVLNFNEPK